MNWASGLGNKEKNTSAHISAYKGDLREAFGC